MQEKLSAEDIVAGYKFILGRNPENTLNPEIASKQFSNFSEFRDSLLFSKEASNSLYNAVVSNRTIWVKTPTYFGRQMYVCLSDIAVSKEILLTGNWEPEVGRSILSLVNPDSYFLDIGANIGWFSLLVADLIQKGNGSGKVVSVEANPSIVPYFMASVTDSGLNNLISIKPYAVSNAYGLIQMETSETGNVGGLNISPLSTSGNKNRNIIPTVVLDDILEDIPKLDVIKMDIEGAEPLALEGMKKLLDKFSPKIIMEINGAGLLNVSEVTVIDLVNQMESYGYKAHDIRKNGLNSVVLDKHEVDDIVKQNTYYDFLFMK